MGNDKNGLDKGWQAKVEFLTLAIEEVQETNRFLDTKASLIAAFVSSLLVIFLSILVDTERLQAVQDFLLQVPVGYLVFLIIYLAAYVILLIVQVLITLQVIFPKEFPEDHINLSGYEPRRLFFLFKVDKDDRIVPAVHDYFKDLEEMGEEDIVNEYIYELEKLSYIRKLKSDRLGRSFHLLSALIIGVLVLGILIIAGTLL